MSDPSDPFRAAPGSPVTAVPWGDGFALFIADSNGRIFATGGDPQSGDLIRFSGQVTFQLDSRFVPKPVTADSRFTFRFFPDTRAARIVAFSDIPLGSNGSNVTAHYLSSGGGSFPANGEMTVPDIVFDISIPSPGSDSTAKFSLSTGMVTSFPKQKFTVAGSPADSDGNIVLVGAGALEGGSPNTDDFSVSFAGMIAPRAA